MIWNNCRRNRDNTWTDLATGVTFSSAGNWTNSDSRSSFFISGQKDFIQGHRFDINFINRYYGPYFENLLKNTIANSEIMYYAIPALEKFKDSKILVVAGGPSASERAWNTDNYDYVFSCNHFFLNEKLNSADVSLATFSPEVDLSENNKPLHDYLKKSSTLICFEDRQEPEMRRHIKFLKEEYPDRVLWAHTRYRGKIGSGPRLLCLAMFLGAKEVHFVGIDGMSKNTKKGDLHNHAFQKGKKYNQTSLNYDMFRRHYVGFWDYVVNVLKVNQFIKLQNLGEGHEKNQSTDTSRSLFPLEKNAN